MEYITHSPEETEALGAEYAKSLKAGDVVAFSGDLGAGKTAFTRGVLHGLGYEGRVTSPTFAIANEYETPTVKVAHFDLYRILDSEALFAHRMERKRRRRSAGSLQNRPYCLRRCGQRPPHYDWRSDCMKILALESSAVSASVALTEDEKLVAQSFQNCGLTHSRTLLPMVENLLANCGVSLADVDAIAVAHGPGSFTGVRIGVATVKGLALGADKPCLGVSTLEAMACDDRAIKLTELAEEIGEAPYFLVGDGADLCYNTIKENCTGLRLAPAELRFATGFGVAAAALPLFREGKACSPQELDAFYLRRPQAERERMARLAQTK